MLHVKRVAFICFLIAVAAFALVRYPGPQHLQVLGKRLIPMPSKEAKPGEPANNPPVEPLPEPVGPGSEAPLFTVDIEQIPEGLTARGTSFPLGNGLWLTARHVANEDCAQIILIVDGANVPAQIKFLDPNADLAVLQTRPIDTPALPIDAGEPKEDDSGYAFGFPKGILGGTETQLMGRARMRLGGRLSGTAPVLTWTELSRYPDSLDSLSGISGGPMFNAAGNVVGIIVAASVRRGRNYTVAPEILHEIQRELGLSKTLPNEAPASDVLTPPVSLDNAATALSKDARIALTYCIPPGS